jgi:hypothetical protein
MAKRKKPVAARKPSLKRGNARRKNLRNKAAKRPAPKKAKKSAKKTARQVATKVRRGGITAKAPARKKKQSLAPAPEMEIPIETTIIDVIEEPVPGVMVITEFESVRVGLPDSNEKNKDQDSARKSEE